MLKLFRNVFVFIRMHCFVCNFVVNTEAKENGDASESEEEWQVIGSKHRGMVTRKVNTLFKFYY